MPRKDGTGPMGDGPMTGRGLGACKNSASRRNGAGMGLGNQLGCRRVCAGRANVDAASGNVGKLIARARKGFGGKA